MASLYSIISKLSKSSFLLIYTFCEKIKSFEAKLTILEKWDENGWKSQKVKKVCFRPITFDVLLRLSWNFQRWLEITVLTCLLSFWWKSAIFIEKSRKNAKNREILSCDFVTSPDDVITSDWRQIFRKCLSSQFVLSVQILDHLLKNWRFHGYFFYI